MSSKTPIMDLETDEHGWIGGSSQSIYARKPQAASSTHTSPPTAPTSTHKIAPLTPDRHRSPLQRSHSSSTSLLERIDSSQHTPPPKSRAEQPHQDRTPNPAETPSPASNPRPSPFRTTPSQGIRRPGAKLPSPLPLTSPARDQDSTSPLNTRTPLSASHPIPETPLKLSQRGGPQTPATPHYPPYPNSAHTSAGDTSRASGLGLGLTPLKPSIPLAPAPDTVRSPLNDPLHLRGRAASNASVGSPLKSARSDLHAEPLALGSHSSNKAASAQIDAMLDRVRSTRSGLGTSASIWAPKPASSANDDSTTSHSSASATSHAIGSGFSSSNLLGVQSGLDRKRPSHRPNGLQLSLGQEISVMQQLEEKAEEDYPGSTQTSATAGGAFRVDANPDHHADFAAQHDGWNGNVVPPTPALGCDSPVSDQDNDASLKAPSRSLDAFGWGSHAGNEPRNSSLFSNLPSSSTLEANWSGDDDDDRKDDMEMFQDLQNRAKASAKEKRTNNFAPLPPPPINYAKSRTPSPTHHMLAKSPQLDGRTEHNFQKSPSLSAPKFATCPSTTDANLIKTNGQRLSPASARSQLSSDDSDGDADVENDKPRGARDHKAGKKHEPSSAAIEQDQKPDRLQVGTGALENKKSLKRDKSERIRGRRASQSKDKDVDKVKMTASEVAASATSATVAAKVSLPSSTSSVKIHSTAADDLAAELHKVDLGRRATDQPVASSSASVSDAIEPDARQTPVANRVQSIPTIKDDLFSSPTEPKVDLPRRSSVETPPAQEKSTGSPAAASAAATSNAADEETKSSVPATPEPSHNKFSSFDWAADDDELDDELPDLDDWGVTLSPSKPSPVPVSTPADAAENVSNGLKNTQKPGRLGKTEEKTWRKTSATENGGKGKSRYAPSDELAGRKPRGASKAARELLPSSKKAASNGDDGSLGIRIAGRAKSASLSPEPETAQTKLAPPASTPYGRWKNQPEEISIKGTSQGRAAPPAAARPRIAADLGALAKLLEPVQEPSRAAKAATDKAKRSPSSDKAKAGSAAQSMHASPSVADSMPVGKGRNAGAGAGAGGGARKKAHYGGGKK